MSYICNECTKRNCRKEPTKVKRREGRYECKHYRRVVGGWNLLELCIDSSPADIVKLCHEHGFKITETKKGYRIKPNGYKRRNVKRRSTRRRFNNAKQSTNDRKHAVKTKGHGSAKGDR